MTDMINDIARALDSGAVIPYLGPEMLGLCASGTVPATPLALAESMTAKVSVPHKIRKRLTQAAQFIENFKHRKSVVHLMNEAFAATPAPSALQQALARSNAGLWVDTWYDDSFAAALASAPGSWWRQRNCRSSHHSRSRSRPERWSLSTEPGKSCRCSRCPMSGPWRCRRARARWLCCCCRRSWRRSCCPSSRQWACSWRRRSGRW